MPFVERLMGVEVDVNGSKLPVHPTSALMREVARGRITGAQAVTELDALLPATDPLRPADKTEANLLLGQITSAGNVTAQLVVAGRIDDQFLLAESGAPGWNTPAKVRAKLGL